MQALRARRSGDVAGATAQLEAILAEQPDHVDSLEVLAMLLSERGELDRAIELTLAVVQARPDSIMGHANLSRFYMLKGDKTTAEDWQAKARVLGWKDEIRRKGESAGPGLALGPDPELVTRQEAAVEAAPADARARLTLAESYRKLDMHAKAIPHLRVALTHDPELSAAHLELGRALEQVGARAEAAACYEKGIPIAERRGDMMARNQMQSRLAALRRRDGSA